ncbi:MAG: O-antigen ligase family protein [bacterium]
MLRHDKNHGALQLLLLFIFVTLLLSTSFFMSQVKPFMAIGIALAIGIFLVSFLDTNVALYILILSMLLSPEFGQRTVAGRGFTLRIEDIILLIVGFAWLAKNAYYKEVEEIGLLRKTPINPYIYAYIVVCAAATAVGMIAGRVDATRGFFFVLKYFEYIIVFFILINHLHTKKQVREFTILLLITCFIVCVIAIVQIPRGVRVSAPFEGTHGEPNTLGGYLVLMLALCIGIIYTIDSMTVRMYTTALTLIITFVLLYTLSRSSWVAALSLVPFFLFFLKGNKRVTAGLTATTAVCLLILLAPHEVRERVSSTFIKENVSYQHQTILGKKLDQSASARISDWKIGLRDWLKNHFILGYGITGYFFMDAQYVKIVVETGIIGLVAFLALIFGIFKYAWRSYTKVQSPLFKGLALGYLAGLGALLVHSIGTNTFIIVRIMEPFWFLTGMVLMLPEIEGRPDEEEEYAPTVTLAA